MSIWEELKQRNVVRVAALYLAASWLILQVADIVFEAFEFPSWSMRFLIVVLALGLPAVLALAWIYELTPDGLRKESEIEEGTLRRSDSRRITLTIGVLVTLAVSVIVIDRLIVIPDDDATDELAATEDAPIGSIAVMPFVNISDEADNDYFSAGLSSELLDLLAAMPELRVTARSSSFSYKGRDVDPRTIGRQLNVANILEGTVRKAGDRLRISVQLIDTMDGFQVWRKSYERAMDDVFLLQNEIAAATVDELRISILGETPRARETDPEAFAAYLHGLHFYNQRSIDSYAKAVQYLREAIAIDPEYPPAWTTLGSTYLNQVIIGELPFDEGHAMAREAVERALDIDPDYANANSARAWLAMTYERDYPTSAEFFERALKFSPGNPIIISNSAVLAAELGLVDRAIELTRESITRNPISPAGYLNLSGQLNRAGRPVEAADAAAKARELAPGMFGATVNLGIAYLLSEQPELALAQADRLQVRVYKHHLEALAYYSLGRWAESDQAMTALKDEFASRNAFEIAGAHAWRGEADSAFEWLDRAIDDGQSIYGIKTEPLFRSLHEDSRWEPLMRHLGLSEDQIVGLTI